MRKLLLLFYQGNSDAQSKTKILRKLVCGGFCRKEAIRTPDPYVPNVVRYQLRYFPFCVCKVTKKSRIFE